ncbi:hypothetical protein [Nesterenkonia pannonica]|uniref:hypothetical protein n=1 Tax=Nesterenkonia pannonica TaxID=1548602 RepID=UPI002164C35E|nr:hypothetical protein [Nesterenkonia pannonica]
MERISDLPQKPGDGESLEYDDDLDRLSTRRDRLRAERAEAHRAPARVRLRLGAVLVVLVGILTWFAVAWLSTPSGADASAEELPDPPEAQHPPSMRPTESRRTRIPRTMSSYTSAGLCRSRRSWFSHRAPGSWTRWTLPAA